MGTLETTLQPLIGIQCILQGPSQMPSVPWNFFCFLPTADRPSVLTGLTLVSGVLIFTHMALNTILYYGLYFSFLCYLNFLSIYVLFPSPELEFKGKKYLSHLRIPSDHFRIWHELMHALIWMTENMLTPKIVTSLMFGTMLLSTLYPQSEMY
jgi:hypothetical protein